MIRRSGWLGPKVLLLQTVLWASPAMADMSVMCIYGIVSEVSQTMTLCGDRLDPPDEATLQEMRAALKKFINDNAKLDAHRIDPEHEERMRQDAEEAVQRGFCAQRDYEMGKNLLRQLLKAEHASAIRKRLETPVDPRAGDCL